MLHYPLCFNYEKGEKINRGKIKKSFTNTLFTKDIYVSKQTFLPWAGSGGPNSREYRKMKLLFHT